MRIFLEFILLEYASLLVPGAEETAKDDEFAEMVGVVVGDEEGFAEEVLAVAPAERFVEIGGGIFDESFEGFEIGADGCDGFVPGVRRWAARAIGPVVLSGHSHGLVATGGWALKSGGCRAGRCGDAREAARRSRGGWRDGAAELGGEIFDGFVEGGVSLTAVEERDELLRGALRSLCLSLLAGLFRSCLRHAVALPLWIWMREQCRGLHGVLGDSAAVVGC